MLQKIIGRKEEQKTLQDCYESNKPEFVACLLYTSDAADEYNPV